MKKLLISCLAAFAAVFPAIGQTEFRHISFDEAKAASKAEGKHIFIDFYTSWCGPCKRLAAEVFPQKQIGDYLNSRYVCLKIDAEKGEGVELSNKFAVKAYPTIAIVDNEGELVGLFAGLKTGDEFIAAVEMSSNPELQPDRVKARYAAGERNTALVVAYATLLRENTRDAMEGNRLAEEVLDTYYASLTEKERLDKENIGVFTTFAWNYSSPRVRFLIDRRAEFDAGCQPQIDKVIKEVFTNEAYRYFTGNCLRGNDDNAAAYSKFRQEAEMLGFADDFERMFEFIDKRAGCDDAEYLSFCDKNFKRLSEEEQSSFANSVMDIFSTDTPEQKKAVSAFLRNHIASLAPRPLYFAALAISLLESQH